MKGGGEKQRKRGKGGEGEVYRKGGKEWGIEKWEGGMEKRAWKRDKEKG